MAIDPTDPRATRPPDSAAVQLQPLLQRALALHRQGRLPEAKAAYEAIRTQIPDHFDALNGLGGIALQTGNIVAAVALFQKAVAANPQAAAAYNNLGSALLGLDRAEEALASYDRALALKADNAGAHYNRGNVLLKLKRPAEAVASYDTAIALRPDHPESHNNRGSALLELKRPGDALAAYDKSLALKPDHAEALYNRGNAALELGRFEEALASYDRAIEIDPSWSETFYNRGNALLALKRPDAALASYDRALALNAAYAEAYNNRGNVLMELNRAEDAVQSFDRAIALKPDFAEACNNRGNAFLALRRRDDALASFEQAIAIDPSYGEAHSNRGNALQELDASEEALASYDWAAALMPDAAGVHANRGDVLVTLRRLDEALASYERAFALNPQSPFLFGTVMRTRMGICRWDDLAGNLEKLRAEIRAGGAVASPFPLLSLFDEPELHRQAAAMYARTRYPARSSLGPIAERPSGDRIRIGYYSADFRIHPMAFLLAELFESHDRARFEVFGFSLGPDLQDEMRTRITAGFEHFHDVADRSDQAIAQASRAFGIDIAVDLNGYTEHARPGIFAEGCAPVQVNYLGYPGTAGAAYMDYVLADRTVIPSEQHGAYTEKVVTLPHAYQVNDSKRRISDRAFTRAELGLPETGFVFCCFNNNHKILPATFDIWMRLLKAVDGSVLWLLEDNATAAKNLRKEAAARGIGGDRLHFAPRMPLDRHLARHRAADLFLDTLPYNAHTTASDALWAGLPLLTCMGTSFASRVAASLLYAVGLPELVTETPAAYETKALDLARDRAQLAAIKRKLATNRLASPLFDAPLMARHLEAAYTAMQARRRAGLQPAEFAVGGQP